MAIQSYIKQNEIYEASLSLDSDADIISGVYQVFISLIFEWGDIIVDEELATRNSAGEYSYEFSAEDMSSYGKHKILWKYKEGGSFLYSEQYINVYQPYITDSEFFDSYPELEASYSDKFDGLERRVRLFIDTVCGQNFQKISHKSLTYEGNNHENLSLGIRCLGIDEVIQKPDVDVTETVEITPESKRFLRRIEQLIPIATQEQKYIQPKFMEGSFYTITADWGWDSVPQNITDAAALLINDMLNDDSTYAKHGISNLKMDQYSVTFANNSMTGTGNIEADVLLMDYTVYTMGLI